ncbi:MAG: hypothetical protein Unbinned5350contig1001_27 [Prokaryotic dsDNA virus sp.]|nr:MAG: hypothetical protein Unbinned5350contig1001_27 [Prokaryotic dsDNA virus sp.]|tara:strand:- start:19437 stop:19613 length:177 start_codon:yes stop_codon:yes gene_type:complete
MSKESEIKKEIFNLGNQVMRLKNECSELEIRIRVSRAELELTKQFITNLESLEKKQKQ